jgi:hypothetical protein
VESVWFAKVWTEVGDRDSRHLVQAAHLSAADLVQVYAKWDGVQKTGMVKGQPNDWQKISGLWMATCTAWGAIMVGGAAPKQAGIGIRKG